MADNEKYIRFFKALANEERMQIVRLLKTNKEMFVHIQIYKLKLEIFKLRSCFFNILARWPTKVSSPQKM